MPNEEDRPGVYSIQIEFRVYRAPNETRREYVNRAYRAYSDATEAAAKLDAEIEDYNIEWCDDLGSEEPADWTFAMEEAVCEADPVFDKAILATFEEQGWTTEEARRIAAELRRRRAAR